MMAREATDAEVKKADFPRLLVIAEILILVGLTWSYARNRALTGDFWVHAAVVRSFAESPFHPANPFLEGSAPHAFFSPYAFLLGVAARISGFSAVDILAFIGGINVFLFFWALGAFVRRVLGGSWATVAIVIPMVLFFWGSGAWFWSGFFHFGAIFAVASYPSIAAGAVSLAGLMAAHSVLFRRKPIRATWIMLVVAFDGLAHPVTAVAFVLGLAALAGTALVQRRAALRDIVFLAGSVGAGVLLALAWPLMNIREVFLGRMAAYNNLSRLLYEHLFTRAWPVLLGTPMILIFARSRETVWAAVWGALLAAAYAAGFILGLFGVGRMISWFGLLVQIALAVGMIRWARAGPRRICAGAFLAAVIALGLGARRPTPVDVLPQSHPRPYPTAFLRGVVGSRDVVLADPETSLLIPAFAGRPVITSRDRGRSPATEQRLKDVTDFFGPGLPGDQARAIIEKYGVKYILVPMNRPLQLGLASRLGTLVARTSLMRLYRVGGP
jgi:hypothetical protein